MGKETNIPWSNSTFSPWTGCTKISAGCVNCYAAEFAKRNSKVFGCWGEGAPRKRTSEANWKQPLKWNRDAERTGTRPRVFCASLADWLDDEVPASWTADLLNLIRKTTNLDWLLLTKRPELWLHRMNRAQSIHPACEPVQDLIEDWFSGTPPANVWIGVTVENQEMADKRIPELLNIPAKVRFLSCEPLLGEINLNATKIEGVPLGMKFGTCSIFSSQLHWVIAGSESGPKRRPMEIEWARDLRGQCKAAGVPFFMKQMEIDGKVTDDITRFPIDLQVREFSKV